VRISAHGAAVRPAIAIAAALLALGGTARAADDGEAIPIAPAPAPFNSERILGVLPDFQTITEHGEKTRPLTRKQKWNLAWKETMDPFNIVNSALGAGFSQIGNQTPKYGNGVPAFGKRFGAAWADLATQNVFSAGIVAGLLRQDPRYFRKGTDSGIPRRALYSLSRLVVTRQDSGKAAFNASGIVGMMLGIAASNAYYPRASVRGSVMAGRLETSLFGGVSGNLLSEFWPDLQRKFLHGKHAKN
jgi:hypothetical protein